MPYNVPALMARRLWAATMCLRKRTQKKKNAKQRARAEGTQTLGRYHVLKKENLDGIKFFFDAPTNGNGAEAWVLFRASGTEPLLRLYTEASSPELVSELLATGESFVRSK